MSTTSLKVAQIEESRKVKVRDQLNKLAVQDYADLYSSSGADALPPLDIFQEKGCKRWIVADGRHRLAAAKKAGLDSVPCKVHEGDDIAALDFAIGCNVRHGVRRSDTDLGFILRSVFNSTELRDKYRTDEALSDKVGVSTKTVQRHRARWRDEDGGDRGAKAKDAKRAARFTPKPSIASSGSDEKNIPKVDRVSTSEKPPAAPPAAAPKKTLTPEQKKVGAQVRDSLRATGPSQSKTPLPHDKVHGLKQGAGYLLAVRDLDRERLANESGLSKDTWKFIRDLAADVLEHL